MNMLTANSDSDACLWWPITANQKNKNNKNKKIK